MASMIKLKGNILHHIRHNMRELPANKSHSNKEIDPARSAQNYDIISRGDTAAEVNDYRKRISQEIFHYKRKDLVESIEEVIALPDDTPPEQEKAFFTEAVNYVASTIPMGEKAVFQAVVHKDEGKVMKDGIAITEVRPHIHILYIPAVQDTKHEGYEYKMCADQLTKRARLNKFHPEFQKWINKAGIKGTVYSGKTGGRNYTVDALKAISKETGMTIDEIRSLKVDKERLQTISKNAEAIVAKMNAQISRLTGQLEAEIDKTTNLRGRIDEISRTNWSLRNENDQLKQNLKHQKNIDAKHAEQNRKHDTDRPRQWGDKERGDKSWQIDRIF